MRLPALEENSTGSPEFPRPGITCAHGVGTESCLCVDGSRFPLCILDGPLACFPLSPEANWEVCLFSIYLLCVEREVGVQA